VSFIKQQLVIVLVVFFICTVHTAGINLTNSSQVSNETLSIGLGNVSDSGNEGNSANITGNLTCEIGNNRIENTTNTSGITGDMTVQTSNDTSYGVFFNNLEDNLINVSDSENTPGSSVVASGESSAGAALTGTETILTPGNTLYEISRPALKGSQIVWIESSEATYWMKVYDLSTLNEQKIPLNKTLLSGVTPSVDNGWIVFYENVNNFQRIFIYNTSSREKTYIPTGIPGKNELYPSLNAENIVYLDDRDDMSNVYLYNVTTGREKELSENDSDYTHYSPCISGNHVIWYDEKDGKIGIYLYNIALGSGSLIIDNTQDINYQLPSIDGNTIVWEDWRNQNFDIYSYNITSKTETLLTPDTNDSDQMNPSVSGDQVVYEDWKTGKIRIFLMNITSGQRYQVSGTSTDGDQRSPRIDGNRIIWQDGRNGYLNDIYLFTVGETRPPVVSDFLANVTLGNVPMTVQFIDTSSGSPSAYLWNFGDGNFSDADNPVHNYDASGIYTVHLTVSTAWSRDVKVMPDFITARSAPSASFIANPPSGPAPLTIVFNDTSTGQPDQWYWDFGDNLTSWEQNPAHTYSSAGNYSVRLVCGNQFGNTTTWNSVLVVPATTEKHSLKIPGEVAYSSDTGFIVIDESSGNSYQYLIHNNGSQVTILPVHGGTEITWILFSQDEKEFTKVNGMITGNLSSMKVISSDISPPVLNGLSGTGSWINVSSEINNYNPHSALSMVISNQPTTEDTKKLTSVIWNNRYADTVNAVACIADFTFENTTNTGPAMITMAVSHDWVVKNSQFIMPIDRFRVGGYDSGGNFIPYDTNFDHSDPVNNLYYYTVSYQAVFNISDLHLIQYNGSLSLNDSRMSIIYPNDPTVIFTNQIMIAVDANWVNWNNPMIWSSLFEPVTILHIDDNGNGEVLNTTHIYYDPEKNLDVFEADSPQGLSEFALTTVTRSGNPLQLLYLSVLNRVSPSSAPTTKPKSPSVSYGGGGGGGSGSYGGSGNTVTPSSAAESAAPSATSAPGSGSTESQSSPALSDNVVPDNPAPPIEGTPQPVSTDNAMPSKAPAGSGVGGFVVPIPNSSVFSLFIEAAAMISVVLIVVFSTFTRYRRKEKD
jgi:beta propeller repeat protein